LETNDSEPVENDLSVELVNVNNPTTEDKDNSDDLDSGGSENSKLSSSETFEKEGMEKLEDAIKRIILAKEGRGKLEDAIKKKIADQRKELTSLILAKVSGNLLESMLSFSLVSYYLIIGTISYHPDVQKPSPLVYLSWAASVLGMFYKGASAVFETKEENTDGISEVMVVVLIGIFILLIVVLIALLPAILIAQDRNGIHTALCPEVISSYKLWVYCTVWGIPMTVYSIHKLTVYLTDKLTKHSIRKRKSVLLFSLNLIAPYSLWLCLTQLTIHKKATFRTDFGLILYSPAIAAAVVLFAPAVAVVLLCLILDISVIFKPNILDD